MRTREEIENESIWSEFERNWVTMKNTKVKNIDDLILEVVLDIRDLLASNHK